MSSTARIRPQADADIDEHFLYIARDNRESAHRFLDAAERTIGILAEIPEMGTIWEFDDPSIPNLRVWPVRGFRNHLVFYQVIYDGIEIVRVLHGARDIDAVFHSESD